MYKIFHYIFLFFLADALMAENIIWLKINPNECQNCHSYYSVLEKMRYKKAELNCVYREIDNRLAERHFRSIKSICRNAKFFISDSLFYRFSSTEFSEFIVIQDDSIIVKMAGVFAEKLTELIDTLLPTIPQKEILKNVIDTFSTGANIFINQSDIWIFDAWQKLAVKIKAGKKNMYQKKFNLRNYYSYNRIIKRILPKEIYSYNRVCYSTVKQYHINELDINNMVFFDKKPWFVANFQYISPTESIDKFVVANKTILLPAFYTLFRNRPIEIQNYFQVDNISYYIQPFWYISNYQSALISSVSNIYPDTSSIFLAQFVPSGKIMKYEKYIPVKMPDLWAYAMNNYRVYGFLIFHQTDGYLIDQYSNHIIDLKNERMISLLYLDPHIDTTLWQNMDKKLFEKNHTAYENENQILILNEKENKNFFLYYIRKDNFSLEKKMLMEMPAFKAIKFENVDTFLILDEQDRLIRLHF